jgi:GAF domain-containing protein
MSGHHRPTDEAARLAALRSLELLDTPAEEALDDLVKIASELCGAPLALISLVDADRQWFKARVGLSMDETPRQMSFCAHAIRTAENDDLFVIGNALEDPRFRDNPLVIGESHVRFYAGAPLRLADGSTVGTLCVLDRVPRTLTPKRCT